MYLGKGTNSRFGFIKLGAAKVVKSLWGFASSTKLESKNASNPAKPDTAAARTPQPSASIVKAPEAQALTTTTTSLHVAKKKMSSLGVGHPPAAARPVEGPTRGPSMRSMSAQGITRSASGSQQRGAIPAFESAASRKTLAISSDTKGSRVSSTNGVARAESVNNRVRRSTISTRGSTLMAPTASSLARKTGNDRSLPSTLGSITRDQKRGKREPFIDEADESIERQVTPHFEATTNLSRSATLTLSPTLPLQIRKSPAKRATMHGSLQPPSKLPIASSPSTFAFRSPSPLPEPPAFLSTSNSANSNNNSLRRQPLMPAQQPTASGSIHRPRISRSKVIAKIGEQRAASGSTAASDFTSASKARRSFGAPAGGGAKASLMGGAKARKSAVEAAALKRHVRNSEVRRKSRVGGLGEMI